MDLPPEIIADLRGADRDVEKGFAVWRRCWPVVEAFICVATQWRQIGLADGRVHWQGLDYAAADVALRQSALTLTPDEWAGLQVMEREAARILNGSG